MAYELFIEIPGLPKLINELNYSHWAVKAKHAKQWKNLTVALVSAKKPLKPLKKSTITCQRHSSAKPDMDNMIISFKNIIDGLKSGGVIEDDSPDHVNISYEWVQGRPARGFITIRVNEDLA